MPKTGESIQAAALRELEEETGLKGKITGLVDADSTKNSFYGDLIFHTFEVEQTGGILKAGDDAVEVKYFPIHKTPELAFKSLCHDLTKQGRKAKVKKQAGD